LTFSVKIMYIISIHFKIGVSFMKKVLMLPLFAMVALVSQAWAESCTGTGSSTACQFDTGCFSMSTEYSSIKGTCKGSLDDEADQSLPTCTCPQIIQNCLDNGALYSGVTGLNAAPYGGGWLCNEHDGQYQGGKLDPNKTVLGCCKWSTETNCYPIWSGTDTDGEDGADKVAACSGGSNKFWSGAEACPVTCPTTPPTYDGTNPADGYCCWEANSHNNYVGSCVPIGGETTIVKCEADSGVRMSSCGGCQTTPTLKTTASVALMVAPYGRSLHISSAKGATVSLYDMNGAKVHSGRVSAGNSVFSLGKVSSGSYYAIVQSGSDSKKIPVILK
jgi:hypothetical protein